MKQNKKKRILIIEDDVHIAEGLKLNLTIQGYEAKISGNGTAGLRLWKEWNPHLIILDIMLPGLDGWSVLRHIRFEDDQLPILILSAKGTPNDRIKGFSCGVDDYLAKPFNLEEFLLRVQRLLTRASWGRKNEYQNHNTEGPEPSKYVFDGNTIDWKTMTAICKQGEIRLTDQEIKLLKIFIGNRGKPLSRKVLLELGWGYSGETSTRTVDAFIVRLRKYFEDNPQKPVFFRSIRSVGYLFDYPDDPTGRC